MDNQIDSTTSLYQSIAEEWEIVVGIILSMVFLLRLFFMIGRTYVTKEDLKKEFEEFRREIKEELIIRNQFIKEEINVVRSDIRTLYEVINLGK